MDACPPADQQGNDGEVWSAELLLELLSESSDSAPCTGSEVALLSTCVSHSRPHATTLTRLDHKRRRALDDNADAVRKSGGIYVKRRNDGRYLTHVVLPKIIKSDIRRSIPQMFCNAQNANDQGALMSFLTTFASKDLALNNVFHGMVNECSVRRFSVYGAEEAAVFWSRQGQVMPDRTSRVLDAQVRARSDGTGVVECTLELRGTLAVWANQPLPCSDGRYGSCALAKFVEILSLTRAESHSDAISGSLSLISVASTAKMRFHLDPGNTVRSVDFEKGPSTVDISHF